MQVFVAQKATTSTFRYQPIPSQSQMTVPSQSRRVLHWDLRDAARNHSWLRASVRTIGKSIIGPGFRIVKTEGLEREATQDQYDDLLNYFGISPDRLWKNIKDYTGVSGKLYMTAAALKLFGHAAWENIRNGFGDAIGFDFVPGIVEPQIDDTGNFKDPAFIQHVERSSRHKIEYDDPFDVVYFVNPDFTGYAAGASDLEALVNYVLPSDIWAALSYRSIHEHRNAPLDGFWQLADSVSDDDFEKFEALLLARYTGAENFGRNPLLIRGQAEFKTTGRAADEAPYLSGRDYNRQEIAGVTGVPGSLLGVTRDMNRASMREALRFYHEQEMLPTHRLLEEAIYAQVCVREFEAPGWMIKFQPPDFLTMVEKASVAMRLRQWGLIDKNEGRIFTGWKPVKDGDGDFLIPANMIPIEEQGGDHTEPTGEPKPSEENPVQGQEPPVRDDILKELKRWRTVALRAARGKRGKKEFQSDIISPELYATVAAGVDAYTDNPDALVAWFDLVLEEQEDAT